MIRAVKYSAAAGFALPLDLKWKIKSQSALLLSVSHSRLTEEIFKIIHSPQAGVIVEALDNMGLYAYLQPQAAALMKENPSYRKRYLNSMAALNGKEESSNPEAIGALINDYLEDCVDFKQNITENYKTIFADARNFILPMNPPRFELERALRRFFASRGTNIKRNYAERVKTHGKASETHDGRRKAPQHSPN
jgi:poly(A) polymerase